MSSWVISSNPTTYNARDAFIESDEIDWVAKQDFVVGDTVYIYEVIPPRGRGGIVYETKVVATHVLLKDKLEDRKYWGGQAYPKNINERTIFSRLRLISESNKKELSLMPLKLHDFTPPQGLAHILDKKPGLLSYIQSHFKL